MADTQFTHQNPRDQHMGPYGEPEQQSHPGLTQDMQKRPDHGEETYKGTGRLKGRRAVITGGDSGIGKAVAIAFAREGADVLISYLESEEKDAQDTAKYVKEAGKKCITVPGDIREEAMCKKIIDTAVKEFGGLDILVNNAAYQMVQEGGILEISTEQFDRVMKTNLYAMFWLSKFAVPHMKSGASVINTTSIQGFEPKPALMDYAMTKAAIVNFTKSLGKQLVEKGIRVNAVAPGPILTPLIPATMTKDMVENFGKNSPLGRPGQPVELSPSYVFYASQESSYITGDVMAVTGGRSIV